MATNITGNDLLKMLELRPKIYCSIYAAPYTIMRSTFKSQTNLAQTLLASATAQNLIGAVQSITVNTRRGARDRRELKTSTAGKPVEIIPGLPSYELLLDRVVLYESNMAQAFGYSASYDVMKQNTPLTLMLDIPGIERVNGNTTTTVGAKSIIIYGVWFDNNNYSFDVTATDDQVIIQSVRCNVTGIMSTKTGSIITNTGA